LQHCCLRFLCCSLCLAGRLAAIVHVRLDAKKGLANLARDSAVSGLYQLCDLGHDEVCQLHKEMRGELCLGLNRRLRGRWCDWGRWLLLLLLLEWLRLEERIEMGIGVVHTPHGLLLHEHVGGW